ncbi:MAG: ATP-binding cassette domain-containing protein [Proteobacteria bacterium]|jgi:lipoprotein-releasing system ATP-binding protein|nr:ATP-binding cassette domain-containing protein [Pseudomonadota bacterium]
MSLDSISTTAKPLLIVEAVSKRFSDGPVSVDVLSNVSLQVHEKQRLAIVGASGSGKSTLLQIMGGLDDASSGRVLFDGDDFAQLNATQAGELRNRSLGFVYQFHHLLPEFSALENVCMPLLMSGYSCREAKQRAADILQRVGLSKRSKHKPHELSGGERQRVAIARAMVMRPQLLLADEPTGNLDRKSAEQIAVLMDELQQECATAIVLVTHDIELAQSMDQVITLSDGEIV